MKTVPSKHDVLILFSQMVFAASLVYSTVQGSLVRSIGRNGGFREALFAFERNRLTLTTFFLVVLMLLCGVAISLGRRRFDCIGVLIVVEAFACVFYSVIAY